MRPGSRLKRNKKAVTIVQRRAYVYFMNAGFAWDETYALVKIMNQDNMPVVCSPDVVNCK